MLGNSFFVFLRYFILSYFIADSIAFNFIAP